MPKILLASVVIVSALVTACGGSGACVVPSVTGNAGWEACHDNWEQAECADRQGTYHAGSTCQAQGYTRTCPADGSNTYRSPTYSC